MKISASMACLPGLPLPFVGGVALAVQIVGVSERYVPSCGTEQTSAPPRNLNGSWPHYGRWCGSHNGTLWNVVPGAPGQSALMPMNFTTSPHFSVSSAISLPKSAGETTSGVPPKSASRALILGSARPALISLLSLSTISTGVFLGMPTPYQLLAS